MSLIVVGTLAFDAIETPFGKTGRIIGGAATYISLAASYFTRPVNIVSAVGGDFPGEYISKLNEHGIDTTGVEVVGDKKSFFWSGKYSENMNHRETLATELNVFDGYLPSVPGSYQDAEYLMLGNLAPGIQSSVIRQLHKRPKLIVLDTMNFWMDNTPGDLKEVIGMIDVLTINDSEARQLSGEYSLPKAASKILEMGPHYLVIKKGENGALLFSEDDVFSTPALLLDEVFDPTGAGDSFAGGFTGYLASTGDLNFQNMKNAVMVGTAMASFCVEKFGTESMISLKNREISIRLDKLFRQSSLNKIDLF